MSNPILYVLNSPRWRLPVEVLNQDHDVWQIQIPAIPLLFIQRSALESALNAAAVSSGAGTWFIQRDKFEDMAQLWDGSPEDAVIWHGNDAGPRKRTERTQDWCELRESLVRAGWFSTVLEAELAMHILADAMMHRLLNEHKPVDLGFCILHASPRRKDFVARTKAYIGKKQIKGDKLFRLKPVSRLHRVLRFMCGPEVTAQWKERLFWTIEALPKRSWIERVALRENLIRSKLGKRYATYVANCLKHTLRSAISIFEATRTQTILPICSVTPKCEYDPPPKRWGLRPVARPSIPDPFPSSPVAKKPVGDAEENLERPDEAMPEVPDLQPEHSDLRSSEWTNLV